MLDAWAAEASATAAQLQSLLTGTDVVTVGDCQGKRLSIRYVGTPRSFGFRQTMTETPVAIVMGSQSDWDTMQSARDILSELGIDSDCMVVSAHRTPEWMVEFAKSAEAEGYRVIIAGAGGAAHLPGMIASMTPLPVLGVPVRSRSLNGLDSLLSIVQMPGGVPVGTLAIGSAGAKNAGLLAARILGISSDPIRQRVREHMQAQTDKVFHDRRLS